MPGDRKTLKGTVRSVIQHVHAAPPTRVLRRAGKPPGPIAGRRLPLRGQQAPEVTVYDPDDSRRHEVRVVVRRRPDAPALPSLDEIAATPFADRRHLGHEEFEPRYGAASDDLAKVEKFAAEYGLEVAAVEPAQRTVRLSGTLARLEAAFGVDINEYATEQGSFLGHAEEISVPAELADLVQAVLGLDTFPVARPLAAARPDLPQTRQLRLAQFKPTQMAEHYDFPAEFDGSGETLGIIALGGGYDPTVLESYFSWLGVPMPEISYVDAGAGNDYDPEDGGDTQEVMLDLEMSGALAPGAKHVVYFGKNDFVRPIQTALADRENNPSVLSISFSSPEVLMTEQEMQCFEELFREAALKGVTILIASGDTGSSISSPNPVLGFVNDLTLTNYPVAHPGAMGVGGTIPTAVDGEGKIESEVVWNYLGFLYAPQVIAHQPPINLGATGGGQSIVWALPDYQKSANVAYATDNRFAYVPEYVQEALKSPAPVPDFGRGVPDVAAIAETYKILVQGTAPDDLSQVGGTSASTPLWASLIIRFNQALKRRCGFLNPTFYNQLEPGALRPITVGGNGAYQARPDLRWNACTGLGVPNGKELLRQLERLAKKG